MIFDMTSHRFCILWKPLAFLSALCYFSIVKIYSYIYANSGGFTMTMYETLPKDPVMLLSFINTQLRDTYETLYAFTNAYQLDTADIIKKMQDIDYEYDEKTNQFI